jgi:hypothetical protein
MRFVMNWLLSTIVASLSLLRLFPVSDAFISPTVAFNKATHTIREHYDVSIELRSASDVFSENYCTKNHTSARRNIIHSVIATSVSLAFIPQMVRAGQDPTENTASESITVPLRWVPKLQAYVLFYSVGGDQFGAILDTGSPFLTVPSYCDDTKWGCYRPGSSSPSGLAPTFERFDNNEGEMEWRSAPFSFINATGSMIGPSLTTFGVLSESLMSGSGGVFFGLVRDTDAWIRPSFLGQTNVRAFAIDLASTSPSLTLTTTSIIAGDYIPLVKDLNRRYGDPTIHYTARAKEILVNGNPIGKSKPIYVIFDTGVTGMVMSEELYNERYILARKNRERNLWGNVEISFQTKQGKTVQIASKKPLTTPMGDMPWKGFNAHLIVIGLSFLDGNMFSVDIDKGRLMIETGTNRI